jgi:hypothetical protein
MKRKTEFIVDCGCYATVPEPDGDCASCPVCKEIANVIEVCAGECGDHDGNSCDCDEREAQQAEQDRMFSLYKGEVRAGFYIPEGTKPELMPELDGFF